MLDHEIQPAFLDGSLFAKQEVAQRQNSRRGSLSELLNKVKIGSFSSTSSGKGSISSPLYSPSIEWKRVDSLSFLHSEGSSSEDGAIRSLSHYYAFIKWLHPINDMTFKLFSSITIYDSALTIRELNTDYSNRPINQFLVDLELAYQCSTIIRGNTKKEEIRHLIVNKGADIGFLFLASEIDKIFILKNADFASSNPNISNPIAPKFKTFSRTILSLLQEINVMQLTDSSDSILDDAENSQTVVTQVSALYYATKAGGNWVKIIDEYNKERISMPTI